MAYRVNLASDLRHRCVIKRLAQGAEKDALGQYPAAEEMVAKVWCGVTPQTVSLLTGPEGGLEEFEVEAAEKAGLRICTLGSRILRCETAPLAVLSAVMTLTGNLE